MTATITTAVGTIVELRYELVDAEHVRITRYRRRKPGHAYFRRVPREEGRVVPLTQLPADLFTEGK